MRLLIVQYSGDYRQVFHKVKKEGIETYHSQKYIVDTVTKITEQTKEVILLCCQTEERYNQVIEPGLRVIGAGIEPYENRSQILEIIQSQKPTHLVVHFPMIDIFLWGIKHQVKIIALLADSFLQISWKRRIKNYIKAKIFNHQQIDWVGNHGLNASYSLQKIGVNPDKIIPWDVPHKITPQAFTVKKLTPNLSPRNLVYVGLVKDSKGVGDILAAVAKLRHIQPINLKIAGSGDIDKFQHRAEVLQIAQQVEFLGVVPQLRVIELMRDAEAVIVPSRHEYPEACPFTIYEALSTHTPIIASDHPMFRGNLKHRHNAMIFPERNPNLLAQCIRELFSNPQLYAQISERSRATWENLQMPVKWGDLIAKWLDDSPENQKWLGDRTLSSGGYNQPGIKDSAVGIIENETIYK